MLLNLGKKFRVRIAEAKHNLEHKHVDWNKIDEMKQDDWTGMCPGQREKLKQLRIKQND